MYNSKGFERLRPSYEKPFSKFLAVSCHLTFKFLNNSLSLLRDEIFFVFCGEWGIKISVVHAYMKTSMLLVESAPIKNIKKTVPIEKLAFSQKCFCKKCLVALCTKVKC